jgi:hypothetical protein
LKARLKLEGRRQPHFHPRRGRRKAFEARESSGSVGARTDGRLQKSVRGIFPASSTSPARVAETALGSTDRRLRVTVGLPRFGRQGCWVNERWSETPARGSPARQRCRVSSRWKASWADEPDRPNPAVGYRVLAWQGCDPAQAGARSAGSVRWSSRACAAARQRTSEATSSGSAPSAEGRRELAAAGRSQALRRAAPGRCGPKLPR